MNIKSTIKTVLLVALPVLLGIVLAGHNTKLQVKISLLEAKKQDLENQNKILEKERDSIYGLIRETDYKIVQLTEKDKALEQKNITLENQIKANKKNYEKASAHANNYTSDSIKMYFSNIQ